MYKNVVEEEYELERKNDRQRWLGSLNRKESDVLKDESGTEYVNVLLEYREIENNFLLDMDMTKVYLPITIRNV